MHNHMNELKTSQTKKYTRKKLTRLVMRFVTLSYQIRLVSFFLSVQYMQRFICSGLIKN